MTRKFGLSRSVKASRAAVNQPDEPIFVGTIECALVRSSRRKSIGINVRDTKVQVRAPLKMPRQKIEQFVLDNEGWIKAKINEQQNAFDNVVKPLWDGGTTVLFNGEELSVEYLSERSPIERVGNSVLIPSGLSAVQLKRALLQWYKAEFSKLLDEELPQYAHKMNAQYRSVHIRGFKSRWGSCSHKGELQFNWLLVLVPPAVRHYVIVHELAHLEVFNHSPQYWRLVERYWPEWHIERNWLRAHQSGLQRYL